MIDHVAHIHQTVKDELAKACSVRGIDKMHAGFAVGGFGALMTLMSPEGIQVGPAWSIMISLRSLLLGQPVVAASIPVPGVMPSDAEFRTAVANLLPQVDDARQQQVQENPLNAGMDLTNLDFRK